VLKKKQDKHKNPTFYWRENQRNHLWDKGRETESTNPWFYPQPKLGEMALNQRK